MLSLTIRRPKESEMTLSSQVKESTMQATQNLREALAFAARSEHPMIVSALSDLIVRVESIELMDTCMHLLENEKNKNIS